MLKDSLSAQLLQVTAGDDTAKSVSKFAENYAGKLQMQVCLNFEIRHARALCTGHSALDVKSSSSQLRVLRSDVA